MTEMERLLEFLYLAPVGLIEAEASGTIVRLNPQATRIVAQIAPEFPPSVFDIFSDAIPGLESQIRTTGNNGLIVDQEPFSLAPLVPDDLREFSLTVHRLSEGRLACVISDVSQLVARERELVARESELQAIVETIREHMIIPLDAAGLIRSHNASIARLSGHGPGIVGSDFTSLFASPPEKAQVLRSANVSGWTELEGAMTSRDGGFWWGSSVISRIVDGSGKTRGYSMVVRNDTDRHLEQVRLREEATRDELTATLNRRGFQARAGSILLESIDADRPVSFCLMDIDHFKRVNDTRGHDAGDAVLREFARRLREAVREPDLVGRLGGEEFGILMPGAAAHTALTAADRVREAISAAGYRLPDGEEITVTASIGIASRGPHRFTMDKLYQAADRALYQAKRAGRNRSESAGPEL